MDFDEDERKRSVRVAFKRGNRFRLPDAEEIRRKLFCRCASDDVQRPFGLTATATTSHY
jgi:hypothetical protein